MSPIEPVVVTHDRPHILHACNRYNRTVAGPWRSRDGGNWRVRCTVDPLPRRALFRDLRISMLPSLRADGCGLEGELLWPFANAPECGPAFSLMLVGGAYLREEL